MRAVSGPCIGEGGAGRRNMIRQREQQGACGDDKVEGHVEAEQRACSPLPLPPPALLQ